MYKKGKSKSRIQHNGGTSTPLKILFFHNTLPEYRIEWFRELSKKCEIKFIFTNEKLININYGFDVNYDRASDINFVFLNTGIEGIKQLKWIIDEFEAYHFIEIPPIDSFREFRISWHIMRYCKKLNIKTGYFWEKWDAPKEVQPFTRKVKNLVLRIVPKLIYKNVDILFSTGTKSKEYFISNGIASAKICVIPDVSETPECAHEDIRKIYNIDLDKKLVVFLGRLLPQKGVDILIRAFDMMSETFQEKTHLIIAGDGESKEYCKNLAKDLNLSNITFAGAVQPSVRGNFFEQCDVFVYPVTHYKGWVDVWGLTINEAIQHGKFVIATDAVGSAYDLIESGVNGFRVEPGNIGALKDALEKALTGDLDESARKKDEEIMRNFSYENMANCYLSFIDNMFDENV